jgi:hypothetical protein
MSQNDMQNKADGTSALTSFSPDPEGYAVGCAKLTISTLSGSGQGRYCGQELYSNASQ